MATAIIFILVLGILIFVHELGHFLTARRNGIRAEEFGFGFPPRIFGIQKMSGRKMEKISAEDKIEVEVTDYQEKNVEIVREKITETIRETDQIIPVKKWRWIWGNYDGDDDNEIEDHEERAKEGYASGTIYSLNWIPLGGFVRIKGENGDQQNEPDSFAAKKPWIRIKVLAAGVIMNFVLAWAFYSVGFIIGNPEGVDKGDMIQIIDVAEATPASEMGLQVGDEILKKQITVDGSAVLINNLKDVQDYIGSYKGKEIDLRIKRGKEIVDLKGVPRVDAPEGQGSLGIQLSEVSIIRYPWYKAPWMGFLKLLGVMATFFVVIFELIKGLFIGAVPSGVRLSGPVEIYKMTGNFAQLGFIYLIQFVALLSVNLGIINAFPIPALDGGRILFILIEKIKGSPVKQKIEQAFHTVGFFLLIALMLVITFHEVTKLIAR